MKRVGLTVIIPFILAIPAWGQTAAEKRRMSEVMSKAVALGNVENCELNNGKKDWVMPNRSPVGDLPIYRCEVSDFDGNLATFTQIPDGSAKKEAVEFCTFSDYYVKCEVVLADRPPGRTADLAKFKVKEAQFEPIRCDSTSVGTMPMSICSKPRQKTSSQKTARP